MQVKFNNSQTFRGVRQDRAFVKQLAMENGYSLAENNQKNILKSIKNISESGTKSGAKFLYETAKNLRYAVNIPFKFSPKNNWKSILILAASACAVKAGLDTGVKNSENLTGSTELSDEEKSILNTHNEILDKMKSYNPTKKDFEYAKNNLEYFIISSETSLDDKKYILECLNYFLSDDYKINPQLQDKKFQAFSEIINDLSLDSVNSDVPNVKAFNQASTGMCVAFSVTRKLLAYEHKRDYVDFILDELDDSETMLVYDRRELGSGEKIAVKKADIDYEGMLSLGMRIVDAATANWMHIADIGNTTSAVTVNYVPYDKLSFNVYNDSHVKVINPDNEMSAVHNYIAALGVTEQRLQRVKSVILKQKLIERQHGIDGILKNAEVMQTLYGNLAHFVRELLGDDYKEMAHDVISGIMGLQKKDAKHLNAADVASEYLYIDNEEVSVKQAKVRNYLNDRYSFALNKNISDVDAEKIYALTEEIRFAALPQKVSKYGMAKALVNAASAFRNQVLLGCMLPDRLQSHMITLDLLDEDEVFLNNIQKLRDEVNTGNNFIIESLSKNTGIPPSKEGALEFLDTSGEYIKNLPSLYDDIYKKMNIGNRKEALIKELKIAGEVLDSDEPDKIKRITGQTGIYDLKELKARINKALDLLTYKSIIEVYSQILDCKPDKDEVLANLKVLLKELSENYEEEKISTIAELLEVAPDDVMTVLIQTGGILTGEMDDVYYEQASRLINQRSIKNDFIKYYENLVNELSSGVDESFVKQLLINNGLPPEFTEENLKQLPLRILETINEMSTTVNTIASALCIEKDGDIINSVYPQHLVLDYYEKARLIPKASVLNKFNSKFEAYDKLYAQKHLYTDKEFRRKKKELMTFTKQEKEELNKILSAVNLMYKITRQEKNTMYKTAQPEYEEIFREYGVKTGRYWTSYMPGHGLPTDKEVALAEAVTGKPYFIQKNLKKAFDDIKHGKFSGITNTSVSDTRIGMHAQYIASIDTITVPSKEEGKYVDKDVLFHDNSWGVSEKDNTWTDSKGLLRTDYNNDYGYKYGYITNDLYRNGTFTDDLLYKKGQVNEEVYHNKQLKRLNPSQSYSFELLDEIVMPGKSTKAISIAKSIRDTMLVDDADNIKVLEKYASNTSLESVKHKLKVLNEIRPVYAQPYREYLKRINGDNFNKGIQTEQDYNALSDNDPLKIVLEKVALRKTYPDSIYTEKIDNIETLQELRELQKLMQQELCDKFGYAFAKDAGAVKYILSERNAYELRENIIVPLLNEYNIETDDKNVLQLNPDVILKEFNGYGYDGSLRSFARTFSDVVVDKLIKGYGDAITTGISKELRDRIYVFTINKFLLKPGDIEKDVPKNVIDWIDRQYKPETDEEFVGIFRKIQNYTFEKFERDVMAHVTDKDLLQDSTSGFDVVKSIQASREDMEDALLNEIFYSEYNKIYDTSIVKPYVRYERFGNKVTGVVYKQKKFDDIYLSLRYSLNSLRYDKYFKKAKNDAFKKYNLLPAYPYIDIADSSLSLLEESLTLVGSAYKRFAALKKQVQVFDMVDWITGFAKEHAGQILAEEEQKEFLNKIQSFVSSTAKNNEFSDLSAEFLKIMNVDDVRVDDYLPVISKLEKRSNSFLKLCSREIYEKKIEAADKDLKKSINIYLRLKILPEYRTRVYAKMNEWFKALRNETPSVEEKYNELLDISGKYQILNEPAKLLDEYLLTLADDNTKDKQYLTIPLKRSIEALLRDSKFIGIEEILMRATRLGLTGAVADEFDNVDVSLYAADGTDNVIVESMSSPDVLLMLVRPLLMENNYEAAREFVTKFNLEAKIVPLLLKMPEVTAVDEVIKDLEKIRDTISLETEIIKDIKQKVKTIPAESSPSEIKGICRGLIDYIKEANNVKDGYYLENLAASLNNVVKSEAVDSLEEVTVPVFIQNVVEASFVESHKFVTQMASGLSEYFYNPKLVVDFIEELHITDNAELEDQIDNFNAWFEDILTRQNDCVYFINSIETL